MISLNKRRLSLVLITVLLFAPTQSVFAAQFNKSNFHAADHQFGNDLVNYVVDYIIDNSSGSSSNVASMLHQASVLFHNSITDSTINDNDRHCGSYFESMSLCDTCNNCTHCVACLPDLRLTNVKNSVLDYLFIVPSHYYLDIPAKDRPPQIL